MFADLCLKFFIDTADQLLHFSLKKGHEHEKKGLVRKNNFVWKFRLENLRTSGFDITVYSESSSY